MDELRSSSQVACVDWREISISLIAASVSSKLYLDDKENEDSEEQCDPGRLCGRHRILKPRTMAAKHVEAKTQKAKNIHKHKPAKVSLRESPLFSARKEAPGQHTAQNENDHNGNH